MHIVVRGIGKQILFENAADYNHYQKKLEQYCLETEVKASAFCLMDNHVHLLVKGEMDSIALLMKKIGVSYSGYYNKKYNRTGHLFQDRYLSEPVEAETYLLTVFRYILQNPQKAGICSTDKYRWSSYGIYENVPDFMDVSLLKELIGNRIQYEKFLLKGNDDQCLEYENKHDDEWAKEEMKRCLGVSSGSELQTYSKNKRDEALQKLKDSGLTIRQIGRLTGFGRNIVQQAGKTSQREPSPLTRKPVKENRPH
jgi:REP element-mobilizing transposase RayT